VHRPTIKPHHPKAESVSEQLVKWGILGLGTIAKAFVVGAKSVDAATITAVGSRSLDKAKAFVQEQGLTSVRCHGSYEGLLADEQVDAIYIATPHPMHARWAIAAAAAGKHVFCEKPATLNHPEMMAVAEAVHEHGVFFMEAFKDRCHPQLDEVVRRIEAGEIGQVRFIQASFGFNSGPDIDPQSRLYNPDLAGGAIMDVGCYAVQFARRVAGAALGRTFADPLDVAATGHLGDTGVDETAGATLRFEAGIVAQVATSIRANLPNTATVVGTDGQIHLPDPWLNDRQNAADGKIIIKRGGDSETIDIPAERTTYGYEIGVATRAILAGHHEAAEMSIADSLGQMDTLDRWRRALKLGYPGETPAGFGPPLNGAPAAPRPDAAMTFGSIEGLDRPVSRFVMGCDNQTGYPHAAVMFDAWLQCGGNTFDTAWLYAGGRQETLLGQWHTQRGVRDQINIIVKGGHTPFCNPTDIEKQLLTSLDRLQTETADIYIMHRDNPEVPVGEFVDLLDRHVRAGRIKVFGGSNWSTQRFREANEYAQANGRQGFTLLSNNYSLARMVNPVWAGCVAASGDEQRNFLIDQQVPNLAWSSQARGYFVSQTGAGNDTWKVGDAWDSPDNRQRRERAFELAERHGVTAINIAAAYVINQPFPSFALIGPRTLEELRTSLPALKIQLSEDEMKYLDLRD
jgi:predicted dehydrogenase/aryl-alcohol dehydrogenase-like predicted oxidoreductase